MKRKLKAVGPFASEGPFTENQLRWWIFNSANNGLDEVDAIVRVGRRVYIDEDGFDRWVSAQNKPGAVA